MTEEAARIIVKRHKKERFGDLINRSKYIYYMNLVLHNYVLHIISHGLLTVSGESWKERLHTLEGIESRLVALAAGSYQNIYLSQE